MTQKELELLTNVCDFTTLFYVIFRRKSWPLNRQSHLSSDLGMRFACNMEPWLNLSQFCILQTLFLVEEQVIKKNVLA